MSYADLMMADEASDLGRLSAIAHSEEALLALSAALQPPEGDYGVQCLALWDVRRIARAIDITVNRIADAGGHRWTGTIQMDPPWDSPYPTLPKSIEVTAYGEPATIHLDWGGDDLTINGETIDLWSSEAPVKITLALVKVLADAFCD